MEKTPEGTSVGVDDPYEHAGVCDHLTDEGRCRFAFAHPEQDREFARERREDDPRFGCPVVNPDSDWDWWDCPHYRSRASDGQCARCGLEEVRMAHDDERPLLEAHHLSYASEGETLAHEITVQLCRWCHAKVHQSWARVDDDATPDPEAVAERERRRGREQAEASFETAAERFDSEE
jgi:hypothetical protein